ncbi:MAG: hypothetical protein ACK517_03990 [bacterium]
MTWLLLEFSSPGKTRQEPKREEIAGYGWWLKLGQAFPLLR